MKVMKKVAISLFVLLGIVGARAQVPAAGGAATPSPDLVNQLTSGLSVTPQQATGGAGAIFGLVKSKLSPAEFSKISGAVPGMDGFLKAAPSVNGAAQGSAQGEAAQQASLPNAAQGAGATQGVTGALGQGASSSVGSLTPGGAGGLASLAGSFQSLGMSPTMMTKFAPIMQSYIGSKGGTGAASAFAGALK